MPVLVIAPRGSATNWVGCLDAGADDYLEAASALPALPARLRALVRRCNRSRRASLQRDSATADRSVLRVGDLTLDRRRRRATRAGQLIDLSQRETDLLALLMSKPGTVYARPQLLEEVWGFSTDPGTKIVEVTINRLREKIDDGFDPRLIETERKKGYRLRAAGGGLRAEG